MPKSDAIEVEGHTVFMRASVGVVALEKLDGDVVGPQVVRAAQEVADALR